ncbi:MAG: histidine phosphatase family protein [Candidatus Riflebacteria bacterium]|nr:histidine phosphatase family protein [Candidatus Riflebacteria bacterium]
MKLCIIRHGETVYNLEERMQGLRDIELTPRGLSEAEMLGTKLRENKLFPDKIYTSPVKRAYCTAVSMGFDIPIISSPGLRSRSLGVLEGLSKTEINQKFPGYLQLLRHWNWCPPGADESLKSIFIRANEEIEKIILNEANKGLAVAVTHSGVLEALIRGWFSIEEGAPLPFVLKNAGALIFRKNNSQWQSEGSIDSGEAGFIDCA